MSVACNKRGTQHAFALSSCNESRKTAKIFRRALLSCTWWLAFSVATTRLADLHFNLDHPGAHNVLAFATLKMFESKCLFVADTRVPSGAKNRCWNSGGTFIRRTTTSPLTSGAIKVTKAVPALMFGRATAMDRPEARTAMLGCTRNSLAALPQTQGKVVQQALRSARQSRSGNLGKRDLGSSSGVLAGPARLGAGRKSPDAPSAQLHGGLTAGFPDIQMGGSPRTVLQRRRLPRYPSHTINYTFIAPMARQESQLALVLFKSVDPGCKYLAIQAEAAENRHGASRICRSRK